MSVKLIMSQFMGTDDTLQPLRESFIDEYKAVSLDDAVHPFQRAKILSEHDFHANIACYFKWISCATAFDKFAAHKSKVFCGHHPTSD